MTDDSEVSFDARRARSLADKYGSDALVKVGLGPYSTFVAPERAKELRDELDEAIAEAYEMAAENDR